MPSPAPNLPAPKIRAIQNADGTEIGRFAQWWAEDGIEVDVVAAYQGEPIGKLTDADGFVLLGGGLMPDADDEAPWLPEERRLTEQAVAQGVPLLGICLGAQLLAHVGGGTVRAKYGAPERGSTALTRRAEAAADPLFGGLPQDFTATENHVDRITELPPGSLWAVSSEACPNQGFRYGERAWGIQFHPEVGAERVAAWNHDTTRERGFDPDELTRTAQANEPASVAVLREFARRFAQIVREHASDAHNPVH